mgnify:CR=1 FL=1
MKRLRINEVYAVDFEGNLSEIPAKKSFVPTGSISENMVWKKEWSPIDIEGDIRIPPLYTLTIEPGTSIRFFAESDNSTGFKKNICEFIVEGTLIGPLDREKLDALNITEDGLQIQVNNI